MSDSGVALVNTTEFCGNHFTTRIAKNDDTHNQTVIRDLYNKFKLLQLSLTERIRETRSVSIRSLSASP